MIEIRENIALAEYTSWLIGGPADFLCFPESIDQLLEALQWADQRKLDVTVMGGGTNVLVSDLGIRGLVVNLRRFSGVSNLREEGGELHFTALAGTAKSELLKVFLKYRLAPALMLAGLPGDVGGGVVMNAGVGESIVPREFSEIVHALRILRKENGNWRQVELLHNQVQWSYRHTAGWQPGIVVSVDFRWPLREEPQILEQVREANRLRLAKQPLDLPSCGSVFVNPDGHKAARLIESQGLKGFRIGDAQVSTKHANFIVNLGKATASDTWSVIRHVQKVVFERTGVLLKTEVVRLGDWPKD
ncbi:MAG: UDP-N-acetylmuramate dehydrogenase [Bdellovibrionaceae bacterium]|nr:UDP-N-acetylmuramate dehydrogenase [Pseudobdellovibrionaceae bacterium]